MINYIWLGLIAVAVAFAGYRDIKGDSPYKAAATVTLANFAAPSDSYPGVAVSNETAFQSNAFDSSSGELKYTFDEGRRARFALNIPSEVADHGAAAQFQFQLLGDGTDNSIVAEVTDEKGNVFYSPVKANLGELNKWEKATFTTEGMIADAENPLANPTGALTISGLVLQRPRNSTVAGGRIFIDDFAAVFPESFTVGEDLQGKTWMAVLGKSTTLWADKSITLAVQLIGIMMLWLGIMRIAEAAGLVQALARLLKPVMIWLFPDLPPDGEAMGAIIMNVAANMLGLGNAATPLGIKAMEEMQRVNPHKQHASNAMCMLLAMNTSSVTLITPTIWGFRAAAGSADVFKFWPVMIMATTISTVTAVLACKLLEKLPIFALPDPPTAEEAEA